HPHCGNTLIIFSRGCGEQVISEPCIKDRAFSSRGANFYRLFYPTSRPRRANRRQLDYSYPDYENLMTAVAARNPSRKRKRQKILMPCHMNLYYEIKDLRFALRIVYEQKDN
ncbi:hypothetical protein DPV78_000153, partial [Talaromyces pinophilus]